MPLTNMDIILLSSLLLSIFFYIETFTSRAKDEVGQLFEDGEYFVSEMLIVARAMQADAAILKPKLVEQDIKPLIPAKAEAGIHADTGRKFKESIHT